MGAYLLRLARDRLLLELRLQVRPLSLATATEQGYIQIMFLLVILCLAVVHAQTVPYVSFLGDIIPNHGYVNLTEVGSNDSSDSVQCITDLSTCCSNTEGDHRGDWYFPDGTRLGFTGDILDREKQRSSGLPPQPPLPLSLAIISPVPHPPPPSLPPSLLLQPTLTL